MNLKETIVKGIVIVIFALIGIHYLRRFGANLKEAIVIEIVMVIFVLIGINYNDGPRRYG